MSFWLSHHSAWNNAFYLKLSLKCPSLEGKFLFKYAPSIEIGFSTIVWVSSNILSPLDYFGLISHLFIYNKTT